jgi:hypothetical protein
MAGGDKYQLEEIDDAAKTSSSVPSAPLESPDFGVEKKYRPKGSKLKIKAG